MRYIFTLLILSAIISPAFSADVPAGVTFGASAHDFKLYYLIIGETVKKHVIPDYGYMTLKAFPLKVREYTFSAPYMDYNKSTVKKAARQAVAGLPEHRKKNACYVSREIFNYISTTLTAGDDEFVPSDNPHKTALSASETLARGSATLLEKCRLACAMLRYFTIPARVAYWKDTYVVEYYIKPLEGGKYKANWQVMDFTGSYDAGQGEVEPISWYPVDSRELLACEWKGATINVRINSVKNSYLDNNEAESKAIFTNLKSGAVPEPGHNTPPAHFYLLKEMDCTICFAEGVKKAEVDFTMPFNESDTLFRTMDYFVKTDDPALDIKVRSARVYIKPPQFGMVYSLPVEFNLKP